MAKAHLPRLVLHAVGWTLLHQLATTVSYRPGHGPLWAEQFLSWGSLFRDLSTTKTSHGSVCLVCAYVCAGALTRGCPVSSLSLYTDSFEIWSLRNLEPGWRHPVYFSSKARVPDERTTVWILGSELMTSCLCSKCSHRLGHLLSISS